ncbi:hypothetical protein MTR_3g467660 [Medicago truncatula]|uniref:Disease resistance protein At4g27190-like leucine-rich repeats domain-containing protein n=1 Tax=Medicago truncatula TaxID=3880 RepID=A0A072V8K3_MEDTR|nr:hypothetical protein MTR_3g467660 [Medicago truncatula]
MTPLEKVGVAPIVEKMVGNRLRWFGHVERRLVDVVLERIDQMEDNQIIIGRRRPIKTIRETTRKDFKDLSGNVEHFSALGRLVVNNNSKVESIFCLNEINEQQMKLGLEFIYLNVLPMMTCLFVGPNNSFSLQNLTVLKIKQCEKLKIVFPTSILRCLPQLLHIRIEECKELKYIIEDDLENKKSSIFMSTKICFPKLRSLAVVKCNKLKYVFPISICKDLPELKCLVIREADELDEIFANEGDDQKVEIPNLEYLVFENLPSLSDVQGIHFQTVKHRFIQNCQTLSLASSSTIDFENNISGLPSVWFDNGTHFIHYI